MKILVTGGAGYIGSHTTNQLLNAGHEVLVYDNLSTGFREAVAPRASFVEADVRDTKKLSDVMKSFQAEAVIHFAAKLNVAESIERPIEYYDNNTNGVVSLINACRENRVDKIVFSSTAAVYGNEVAEGLIKEGAPIKPINPYGWSKFLSEQILRDAEKAYGIRTVILRYFNVAGASTDGKNGQRTASAYHLIHIASQAVVGKRRGMGVFGSDYPTFDGTCVRDYIHVEDLAELHILGLGYLRDNGFTDTFNCGYGHGYSVKQVINAMKTVTQKDIAVEHLGRRAGDPASLVASSEKAKSKLGWNPKYNSIELICSSAAAWEQIYSQR